MATKPKRLKQVRRVKKFRPRKLRRIPKLARDLRRLKRAGVYSGKIDKRRKRPTSYQQRIIKQFADVLRGRATVVRPKNPASYGRIFKRRGRAVIVPRGKGEKIRVNKAGNIVRERRGPRGEKIIGTFRRTKPGEKLKKPPATLKVNYAIPFARRVSGGYRLEWHRFPNFDLLQAFMQEYEKSDEKGQPRYPDWPDYVLIEIIVPKGRLLSGAIIHELLEASGTSDQDGRRLSDLIPTSYERVVQSGEEDDNALSQHAQDIGLVKSPDMFEIRERFTKLGRTRIVRRKRKRFKKRGRGEK